MAGSVDEILHILRAVLRDDHTLGAVARDDLELSAATRFDNLPDWDSMDLVAVVVEIECRYDLWFEAAEIDRLATVDDLVRAIDVKRALAAV